MNARDLPPLHASPVALGALFTVPPPTLTVRIQASATESDIPGIYNVTAGAVVIARAAIVNELCDLGLAYPRALVAAAALLADCIVDDSEHTEWNGHRMAKAPRWYFYADGRSSGHFETREACESALRTFIRTARYGSEQWKAIADAEDIERYDTAQRMTAERNARDAARLRRAAGFQ